MSRLGSDGWRWPLRIVLMLGILLVVTAPILRLWVTPALAQAPLVPRGGVVVLTETGSATSLFDLETGTAETAEPIDVTRTTTVRGDLAAGEAAAADGLNVAVSTAQQITTTAGGRALGTLEMRLAADRHSQALVDCCGAEVGGVTVSMAGSGSPLRLPWFTPEAAYPYFDPTLLRSVDLAFLGRDEVGGRPALKFQQASPATALGTVLVPGQIAGSDQLAVTLSRVHSVNRTLWVDPTTGIILRSAERISETIRDSANRDLVVLLALTLGSTPEQEAIQAAVARRQGLPVLWTHSYGPALCLTLGGLLLAFWVGMTVLRTRERRVQQDFPDELASFEDLRDGFE